MARQQKAPVAITTISPRMGYKKQWHHSASPTNKNPNPNPYVVSMANDGNWSCDCMNWTRTHPRTECKHILKIQVASNTPQEIKIEPKMQFVQATGRMFRDA
jgi:hypothetical protein